MNKRDFFYKPSIVEDWLVDYKDALEIDLKSVQPYVSLYRMSEHPDFIGYIKSVQGVWAALEQVPSYSQPEQVVTVTRNLQEVV